MAAIRQTVFPSIDGDMVSEAYVYLVNEVRKVNIKEVKEYQHKSPEADTVPFLDVYSEDTELADKSTGTLNNQTAIYPENMLKYWHVERMIVVEEMKTKTRHFAKGLVILRSSLDQVKRLWVMIERKYSDTGNHYHTDRKCYKVTDEERKEYLDVLDNPLVLHDPDPGSKADS